MNLLSHLLLNLLFCFVTSDSGWPCESPATRCSMPQLNRRSGVQEKPMNLLTF